MPQGSISHGLLLSYLLREKCTIYIVYTIIIVYKKQQQTKKIRTLPGGKVSNIVSEGIKVFGTPGGICPKIICPLILKDASAYNKIKK